MNRKFARAMLLIVLSVGFLVLSVSVEKSQAWNGGTIYIRANGTVEPVGAPILINGDVYTVIDNVESNDSGIVIERNNMLLDGAGHTVQGVNVGISFSGRNNVTIQNFEIKDFVIGVDCQSSSSVTINGCNMTGPGISITWGVYVLDSSFITVSGNTMMGYERGIQVHNSSRNSISGNSLTNNLEINALLSLCANSSVYGNEVSSAKWGIQLGQSSSNNDLHGNHVVNNSVAGFAISDSNDNDVYGNNVTSNILGVRIQTCSNNNVSRNSVTGNNNGVYHDNADYDKIIGNNVTGNFGYGIDVVRSSHNIINENNIVANSGDGIRLEMAYNVPSQYNEIVGNNVTEDNFGVFLNSSASFNTVKENSMVNNVCGIWLGYSSDNLINDNNFLDNQLHAHLETLADVDFWDDGVEGNFWSNYTGFDLNSDGIGDTPFIIGTSAQDNYPLMGMFHGYNVEVPPFVANATEHLSTISNSTITDFGLRIWLTSPNLYLQPGQLFIGFTANGADGTTGFCRMLIPNEVLNSSTYIVLVDLEPVNVTALPISNSTHTYLYFAYSHSTLEIIVVPEFSSFLLPALLTLMTFVTVTVYRRRQRSESDTHLRNLSARLRRSGA